MMFWVYFAQLLFALLSHKGKEGSGTLSIGPRFSADNIGRNTQHCLFLITFQIQIMAFLKRWLSLVCF